MTSAISLAALLAFAPAQNPGLTVSNVRMTYRELGPTRTDNKFLPYDHLHIEFTIDGLKSADDGRVGYTMAMEVLDKIGKAIFTAPSNKYEMILSLGGSKLLAHVFLPIDPDLPPGPYTCKVTIGDAANKATKSFEQKFEILPTNFGMVGQYVSYDEQGAMPCGTAAIVGQTVWLHFGIVGFGRDATKKANSAVEIRVLDETGKPTVAKPILVELKRETGDREQFVHCYFPLVLNREGNFKVEMKAVDRVANKSAEFTLPIKVYPASK